MYTNYFNFLANLKQVWTFLLWEIKFLKYEPICHFFVFHFFPLKARNFKLENRYVYSFILFLRHNNIRKMFKALQNFLYDNKLNWVVMFRFLSINLQSQVFYKIYRVYYLISGGLSCERHTGKYMWYGSLSCHSQGRWLDWSGGPAQSF